ncbi:glutenin, high molecular weight subunit 12-like [Belonocnema kinseyi]|uniref:glutenin, high molecular weight subunit 12-like n=1 Tax=Belonocnema kinseyi TaxID=2817044 RepID=UPI00143D6B45|nr:glutenin, high molecular weight subunit 12-like [Belonocnema kinseyi]
MKLVTNVDSGGWNKPWKALLKSRKKGTPPLPENPLEHVPPNINAAPPPPGYAQHPGGSSIPHSDDEESFDGNPPFSPSNVGPGAFHGMPTSSSQFDNQSGLPHGAAQLSPHGGSSQHNSFDGGSISEYPLPEDYGRSTPQRPHNGGPAHGQQFGGHIPQGPPPDDFPPQGPPPHEFPPQGPPPHGYQSAVNQPNAHSRPGTPRQGHQPRAFPPQGPTPQGLPPQGSPHGYQLHGRPPPGNSPLGNQPNAHQLSADGRKGKPPKGMPKPLKIVTDQQVPTEGIVVKEGPPPPPLFKLPANKAYGQLTFGTYSPNEHPIGIPTPIYVKRPDPIHQAHLFHNGVFFIKFFVKAPRGIKISRVALQSTLHDQSFYEKIQQYGMSESGDTVYLNIWSERGFDIFWLIQLYTLSPMGHHSIGGNPGHPQISPHSSGEFSDHGPMAHPHGGGFPGQGQIARSPSGRFSGPGQMAHPHSGGFPGPGQMAHPHGRGFPGPGQMAHSHEGGFSGQGQIAHPHGGGFPSQRQMADPNGGGIPGHAPMHHPSAGGIPGQAPTDNPSAGGIPYQGSMAHPFAGRIPGHGPMAHPFAGGIPGQGPTGQYSHGGTLSPDSISEHYSDQGSPIHDPSMHH